MQTELLALLLDVDGTLADTEDIHRQAFNAAFAEAGLDWVWDQALYGELLAVTGGKERIRYFLERERPEYRLPEDGDGFIAEPRTVGLIPSQRLRPALPKSIPEWSALPT